MCLVDGLIKEHLITVSRDNSTHTHEVLAIFPNSKLSCAWLCAPSWDDKSPISASNDNTLLLSLRSDEEGVIIGVTDSGVNDRDKEFIE